MLQVTVIRKIGIEKNFVISILCNNKLSFKLVNKSFQI